MTTPLVARLFWLVVTFALVTGGCRWIDSDRVTSSQTSPVPVPALLPTSTPERPAVVPARTPPTTRATPTPTVSLPTPGATPAQARVITPISPEPPGQQAEPRAVAACCGVFAWMDGERIVVYDVPHDAPAGAWLVELTSGESVRLGPRFGLPSPSGLVAVSDPSRGSTSVVDSTGREIGAVENGGTVAWLSPDGEWLAWLERLPVRTPSSSLNRVVRLWVAETRTGERRPLLDLQAASVTWFPDNRRLLVAARAPDGSDPGIWVIDRESGHIDVVVRGAFLYNVRLSPDGSRIGYVRALSGEPSLDGVWIVDLATGRTWRLPIGSGFRWAPDSSGIWLLSPSADGEPDRLVLVDVLDGTAVRSVRLAGRVSNATWDVAPSGDWVVFWRQEDGRVVVQPLGVSSDA